MRKPDFRICENKGADQLVTAQLISAFAFATQIVQFLYFLNPNFQASTHLVWLHSPVCVGPARKPRRPVFSHRGSNDIIKMNRHASTIIYSMYRVDALRTPSRLRAGYPTLLQWRGRYGFSRLKTIRVLPHTSVTGPLCQFERTNTFKVYLTLLSVYSLRNSIDFCLVLGPLG